VQYLKTELHKRFAGLEVYIMQKQIHELFPEFMLKNASFVSQQASRYNVSLPYGTRHNHAW